MVLDMKETGLRISSMALVLRDGQMVPPMKANTNKVKSMEKVNLLGLMPALSLGTSWITTSMAVVSMNGLTAECTQESGRTIRWKDTEHLHGQMVGNTLVSILTI